MADEKYVLSSSDKLCIAFIAMAFIWMLFATTAQAAPLNASLSAYYRFDNNVLDIFRNNTMTVTGSVDYNATCKLNGCYKFDGANDVFVTTRGWKWTRANSHSYAFWLLSADTGATDKIWYHANTSWGYDLIQISDTGGGVRNVTFFGSSTAYPVAINKSLVNSGTWRYIIVTINSTGASGVVSIYVDGTLRRQKTANMQVAMSTESFFGAQGFAGNRYQGHLDELSTWNKTLNSGEVAYLYNSGSARGYNDIMSSGAPPAVTSAITFYKPDRPDILNYTTRTLFKVSGSKASYSNVNITINGVKVKTYATLANNTNQTYWFNASEGNVTIGVYANNTFNATKVFRHLFYNVTDRDFRTSVNETTLQETNITIANGTGIIIQKVNLTIEGHATENITGASLVGGKYRAYYYAMVPSGDGATETLWWNITVRLPDGTVQKNRTSYAVAHHFGYNITGAALKPEAWEGALMHPSVYIKMPTYITNRNGTIRVGGYINGTLNFSAYMTNPSGANGTYHPSFNAPAIGERNATKIISFNLTVKDKYGQSRVTTFRKTYAQIFSLNMTNRSTSANPKCNFVNPEAFSIVIRVRNEATGAAITTPSFESTFKYWANTTVTSTKLFAGSGANSFGNNITLCNIPVNYSKGLNGNSSLRVNASIFVSKTGFSSSSLTILNSMLNATSRSTYDLYLANSTLTTPTTYYLYGEYDAPLSGYTLRIQKLFYATGAYVDIFSGIAGTDGSVVANVKWYDTYYNYIILDPNGTVVKQFSPSVVSATPVFLRTTSVTENWPSIYTGIQSNCVWDNSTKLLSCTLVDSSGTVTYGRLTVTQAQVFGSATICTETAYGSAITLVCDLANATGNLAWTLVADMTGYSEYLVDSGSITQGSPGALTAGNMGMFGALIFVIAFGVGGFATGGLGFGLIGAVAGWVISGMLGLYALGNINTEWAVVVGIALAALIALMVHER